MESIKYSSQNLRFNYNNNNDMEEQIKLFKCQKTNINIENMIMMWISF